MRSERFRAIAYRLLHLLRRPPYWLRLGVLVAAIIFSYVFIISAGTFTHWATWNNTYDLIAEGFRAGHLYILADPHPELLRAANPFDPSMHNYWMWDASLYGKHIYFYWGPLPALFLAGLKAALSWNFVVGDQYFVFAFYTMHLVAGTLLLSRMARWVFPDIPFTFLVLGVLVFAYASPTPYIVATPGIYQAAIIGGQAFLLAGMVFAVDALREAGTRPPARARMLAAGCLWGLGIATRISLVLPVPLIVLMTSFLIARPDRAGSVWWQRLRAMIWLGVVPAAFLAALLVYNRVRFDSFLEFGTHIQMSTMQFRTSIAYLLPDLYSYFFRPMVMSCRFPFFTAPFGLGALAFPKGFTIPPGYWIEEPVAGLGLSTPWIWFVPVAIVFAARASWRALRTWSSGGPLDPRAGMNLWFAATFAVIGTVTGLPVIMQFIATMRYLVDFTSGLVLLATWGAWSLYTSVRARPWLRRAVTALIIAVSVATIALGLLLGVTGYNDMFPRHNPALFDRMVKAFSVCG